MKNKETFRYDVREDRANDIKKHDNPNHPSKHSHDRRKAEAEQKLKEHYDGRDQS